MTGSGAAYCHGGYGSSILQSRSCRRSRPGTFNYLTQYFDGVRALEYYALSGEAGGRSCAATTSNSLPSSSHTVFNTNTSHDSDDTLSCIRAYHLFSSLNRILKSSSLKFPFPWRHRNSGVTGQQGHEPRWLPNPAWRMQIKEFGCGNEPSVDS